MKRFSEFIVDKEELQNTLLEKKSEDKTNLFFKNIIVFTTNKSEEDENLVPYQLKHNFKDKNISIYYFNISDVKYKISNHSIRIFDKETKLTIKDQSNIDTIVISRVYFGNNENGRKLVNELSKWGFLVVNDVYNNERSANKYQAALLLDHYDIPQPKFALIDKSDIIDGAKSLQKKIKQIYPEYNYKDEKTDKLELVIKILDGHGGSGVFMSTAKDSLAILQTIFTLTPDVELLMQKKEKLDGGDIRVHVITMRNHQYIIGALKRKQLGRDFRSNISLGAEVENIELTDEQKELALKVAKVSGLVWCGVDIGPLVKGSNPELGNNIVIEYNGNPGWDGIYNTTINTYITPLLESFNHVDDLPLKVIESGFVENIKFWFNNLNDKPIKLECKLDTGNTNEVSRIGFENIEVKNNDIICTLHNREYRFKKHREINIDLNKNSIIRYTTIIPCIQMGTRKLLDVEFALVDDRKYKQKVLLNCDLIKKMGYSVNSSKQFVLDDMFIF